MLDENDVLITQLRRVMAKSAGYAVREGMILGWWLRGFKLTHHDDDFVCQCDMCQWQRGEKAW